MGNLSARGLKILSAAVWITGGVVLLLKGCSLLVQAGTQSPGRVWPLLAVFGGLLLGGWKGRVLFSRSCEKNLIRIDALERPRVWQFFRPGFFVFLLIMILAGATLSRMAQGNYPFLIGVAFLDLSIATALIESSYRFWAPGTLHISVTSRS